ncbi:MAG: O-antigen ligase family protein [Opitutae bacterium]|nr:O-antigen ligase family protein [Opitutae bacterium]
MNPVLQRRLLALAALPVALLIGWQVAHESLLLPLLLAAGAAAFVAVRFTHVALDVAVLGLLLFGYVVGNRGFAQQMPFAGLPLFPAEFGLALGGGWLLVKSAWHKELPWRGDLLNWTLLLWIAAGTARLAFDVRREGFMAVRDYAMVYYAGFFFVAQQQAADARARRFLRGCLLWGVAVLLPVYPLFKAFPEFFVGTLTVRGVPLIFYKNDLVQTFLAAGSVVLFQAAMGQRWALAGKLGAILLGGAVLVENSRAALVGLAAAAGWLALTRKPAYLKSLALAGALALVGLLFATWVGRGEWRQSSLVVMYERVASMFDVQGTRTYASEELGDKPNNNRFRLVWWRSVIGETWENAPAFGLGFGHDLAERFLRVYEFDLGEDFNVRSPHSFPVTVFGRMGAVGALLLLALIVALTRITWRRLREADETAEPQSGLWCACWVILVSACFGVVLEGPMGAVVFWTLLGLANGTPATEPADDAMTPADTPASDSAAPPLPKAPAAVSVDRAS